MIPIKNYKVCITNVDFMLMRIFSHFHMLEVTGVKWELVSHFTPGIGAKWEIWGVFVESISEQFLLGSKPTI